MEKVRAEVYRRTIDEETGKEIKHYRFVIYFGSGSSQKPIKKTSYNGQHFFTKTAAINAGNEYYKRYILGEIEEKLSDIYFSEYLDKWYDKMCTKMELTTTVNYFKIIKNHLKPALGNYLLSAIKKPVVEEFLENLVKKGYKPNTIDNIKGVLTKSIRYAYDNGYIEGNAEKVIGNLDYTINSKCKAKKKLSTQQQNIYITDNNFKTIISRFSDDSNDYLAIMIAHHLGTRLGETFGLAWDDFDFEKKQVIIRHQLQYDNNAKCWYIKMPKHIKQNEYQRVGNEAFRIIGVDDALIAILKKFREKQVENKKHRDYHLPLVDDNGYLNSFEGEPIDFVIQKPCGDFITPNNAAQAISKIIHDELGLPFTFHSLRHTHCTNLVRADMNPFYIFYRMGHKSFKTTQKYLHNNDDFISAGSDKLNAMFK